MIVAWFGFRFDSDLTTWMTYDSLLDDIINGICDDEVLGSNLSSGMDYNMHKRTRYANTM